MVIVPIHDMLYDCEYVVLVARPYTVVAMGVCRHGVHGMEVDEGFLFLIHSGLERAGVVGRTRSWPDFHCGHIYRT